MPWGPTVWQFQYIFQRDLLTLLFTGNYKQFTVYYGYGYFTPIMVNSNIIQ